jgi:hypothetical protein
VKIRSASTRTAETARKGRRAPPVGGGPPAVEQAGRGQQESPEQTLAMRAGARRCGPRSHRGRAAGGRLDAVAADHDQGVGLRRVGDRSVARLAPLELATRPPSRDTSAAVGAGTKALAASKADSGPAASRIWKPDRRERRCGGSWHETR